MGSVERRRSHVDRFGVAMLHERDSFFDRHKRHFGRLLEPAKSEIVVFAKDATLGGFDSAVHEQKDSTS